MALVPFKNLLRFLQKKCSKHLKIDQKDMSRVAKFVSHDGSTSSADQTIRSPIPSKNNKSEFMKGHEKLCQEMVPEHGAISCVPLCLKSIVPLQSFGIFGGLNE